MHRQRPCPVLLVPVLLLGCLFPSAGLAEDVHVDLLVPGAQQGTPFPSGETLRWAHWLRDRGYDAHRCGLVPKEGRITLSVESDADLAPLESAGFRVVTRHLPHPLEGDARTQSEYFDPNEIATILQTAAAEHPGITRLFSVGTSFQGRTIWGIEISDNPGVTEDEPAIQFNAQHHSREVATCHIVIDLIETLTNGYGSDPDVTSWVDDYKTVCVPMVNPDGTQYVFDVDSFWRKNRQFYDVTCTGVDLNRNYPYRWGPDRCGFASSCSSPAQTYQGPSAASEIETMAMIQLARDFHFVMATSYHSAGQFIDYPYACSSGQPDELMPEHDVIDEMMNGMADAIDAVDSTPRYDVFSPASAGPLSGDDTSWYYAEQGTYAFLVEVGTSFEPSFSLVAGIVNRNAGGWRYLYERLGEARIDVHVTDRCTGEPLEAEVTLTDYVYDTGEAPRMSFLPFGRWTYVVVANDTYTVRAEKPGYQPLEMQVAVGNAPAAVDLRLTPDGGCPPTQQAIPVGSPLTWGFLCLLVLGVGLWTLRRSGAML